MNHVPDTVEPVAARAAPDVRLNLVLDTNVWLDWLVFGNPSVQPLAAPDRQDSLTIWTNAHGRGELAEVISRSGFALDTAQQADCLRRFDALTNAEAEPCAALTLQCRDPADQPFLELAVARQADYLLSRDRALLKLARQARRCYQLTIVTPEQFNAALAAPSQPGSGHHG